MHKHTLYAQILIQVSQLACQILIDEGSLVELPEYLMTYMHA